MLSRDSLWIQPSPANLERLPEARDPACLPCPLAVKRGASTRKCCECKGTRAHGAASSCRFERPGEPEDGTAHFVCWFPPFSVAWIRGRVCTGIQSGPVERPVHHHLPLFHIGRELLETAMNMGLQAWPSKDLGAWWPVHLLQHFFLHRSFMTPAIGDCAHPDKPEEPSRLATSGVTGHCASCPQPKKYCFHGCWPSKGQDLAASSSWLGGN